MISIIYSTNRIEPRFEWFIQSLWVQTTPQERQDIEIIYIDYCKGQRAPIEVNGEFKIIHAAPKPNIYQGPLRKTTGEYFSPASARNTGVLLSQGDYIVFVDDVSILMPGWWDAVKRNARRGITVTGSYQKHFEMVVEDGQLVSSRAHDMGKDSRWSMGGSDPMKLTGSILFGCSLGIPSDVIMAVNGFDEICDSIGGEDYHLGIRLNHSGVAVYYDRQMMTVESEELHNQPYLMKREDRVLPQDQYMERLKYYGVSKRHYNGNWDSSHMILDILYGTKQKWTIGNNYNIAKDRPHKMLFPMSQDSLHWFDKKPLIEML